MPNGSSGGFEITKEDLLRLLSEVGDDTVIGSESGRTIPSTVTASEARRMLGMHKAPEVLVEEQYHEYFTLWIIGDPLHMPTMDLNHWILIERTSPVHDALRRRFIQAHPQPPT